MVTLPISRPCAVSRKSILDCGCRLVADAIVNKAKAAVAGLDVASVKTDVHSQDSLKESMSDLVTGINDLAINRPARKLSF